MPCRVCLVGGAGCVQVTSCDCLYLHLHITHKMFTALQSRKGVYQCMAVYAMSSSCLPSFPPSFPPSLPPSLPPSPQTPLRVIHLEDAKGVERDDSMGKPHCLRYTTHSTQHTHIMYVIATYHFWGQTKFLGVNASFLPWLVLSLHGGFRTSL